MTTYEQIKQFEEELSKTRAEIESLEKVKEGFEETIGDLEHELTIIENNITIVESNLTESDPDYLRYWAEKLTCDQENFNGQFKFQDKYAVCNGYVIAVFNEPIDGIPICDGTTLDFFAVSEKPLSVRTSEIETQDTEHLIVGDAEVSRGRFAIVRKVLRLDDTAIYSTVQLQGHSRVIVKCPNGQKALIMGECRD